MPTTASFIVELVKPNGEAIDNKRKAALHKPGSDMCPYCQVYNDLITIRQTLAIKGAPGAFSNSPCTIFKPELTVELPCGCKMHYDCVLHELRAHDAYIFAEEYPHFACPKCRCKYSEVEQQHMERNLSFVMPADYIWLIWDSNEGVHRRLARLNHTDGGPQKGRARAEGWWAKDSRPPKIYMNAIHPGFGGWNEKWGMRFQRKDNNCFWETWPQGPVRSRDLYVGELPGAIISQGTQPVVWTSPGAEFVAIDNCQLCEEASALEELLNRLKTDRRRHFSIFHCTACAQVVLVKPGAHAEHYPPDTCAAQPIRPSAHTAHRTAFDYQMAMPLNDPRSTLAFIDEGGNPFGGIPEHAELCIKSTEMLREREDLTIIGWPPEENAASSRSQNNHYGQAPMPPLMAVMVGSNFDNRRNIISLETMKLQIIDMLTNQPEGKQTKGLNSDEL